jgi:hypothetical protein
MGDSSYLLIFFSIIKKKKKKKKIIIIINTQIDILFLIVNLYRNDVIIIIMSVCIFIAYM